jgi:hypothetical protein
MDQRRNEFLAGQLAGESRAVAVYPGLQGYAWLQQAAESEGAEYRRLLVTEWEMVAVAYPEDEAQLGVPDRELLEGCRRKGWRLPVQFRNVRPGANPVVRRGPEGWGLVRVTLRREPEAGVELWIPEEELTGLPGGGESGSCAWGCICRTNRWGRKTSGRRFSRCWRLAGSTGGCRRRCMCRRSGIRICSRNWGDGWGCG